MSEKLKHIDNLFRDKFEHFEVDPPAHIWEKVKSELAKNTASAGKAENKGKGITGASLIIIVAVMLTAFLMNQDNPQRTKANTIVAAVSDFKSNTRSLNIIADNSAVVGDNEAIQDYLSNDLSIPEIESKSNTGLIKTKSEKKTRKSKKSTHINPVLNPSINLEIIGKTDLTIEPSTQVAKKLNAVPGISATSIPVSDISGINLSTEEQIINTRNQHAISPDKKFKSGFKSDYGKKGAWGIGAYFTPELIKYNADNDFDNRSYSVEVLATHSKNNFLIQTGIGLSKVTDKGNYHIDYNKFLGSYEDVYNVTFDTVQGELIPVYYTETVDVYDTVYKTIITPTKRNFTYLNIPFMIGYASESKRFGWFVKAGPSLSLMLSENIPDVTMPDPENKIVLSENELPQRVKANWQFMLSAGTSMKLNRNVSISIEPVFRYYIKSAYEPNRLSTKHPYSIGLRAGLLFDF